MAGISQAASSPALFTVGKSDEQISTDRAGNLTTKNAKGTKATRYSASLSRILENGDGKSVPDFDKSGRGYDAVNPNASAISS
jgi:hypothetical protein